MPRRLYSVSVVLYCSVVFCLPAPKGSLSRMKGGERRAKEDKLNVRTKGFAGLVRHGICIDLIIQKKRRGIYCYRRLLFLYKYTWN